MNKLLHLPLLFIVFLFTNLYLHAQEPPPPPPPLPPPVLSFPPTVITDTSNVTWKGKTKKKTRSGEWKAVDRNNSVVVNATYSRGVLNGNWASFYSNGTVRERGMYVNGKRNGVWIGLRTGGDSVYRATYVDGELHGPYCDFYPGNKMRSCGTFQHGKKEGQWELMPLSFSKYKHSTEEYVNGTLHGVRRTFSRDKLIQEETYLNGKKNGPVVDYDEKGRVKQRINFINDIEHGPAVRYGHEGDTIEYGSYTNGRRSGYWEMRDRGKITMRIWFSPLVNNAPPVQNYGAGVRVVERPDSVYRYAFSGRLREKEIFRDTTAIVWAYGGVSQVTEYYEDTLLVKTTYTKVMQRTAGAVRNYYRNGQLSSVVTQEDGRWYGPAVWYHNNGALRARDTLVNSRLTHRLKLYDRKGKLIAPASKNYELMKDSLFTFTPGLRSSEPETVVYALEDTNSDGAEEAGPPPIEEMEVPPIDEETPKVYAFAEEMPSFKGGHSAFLTYLENNMQYPQAEKDAGVTGIVYVYFEVTSDGSIVNVRTLKAVPGHPAFSMEAERLIREMPAWNPGKMNGRPVTVSQTVPVKFALNK